MYIFALDTPLTRSDLREDLRKQAADYGISMLKIALLFGHSPILSENQIVDSTAILLEASNSIEFVKLIESGHIRLSTWSDVPRYEEALSDFLRKDNWRSSAWGNLDRDSLSGFLSKGGRFPSEFGVEGLQLYSGLRILDIVRKRGRVGQNLIPAKTSQISLSNRIISNSTRLPGLAPAIIKDFAQGIKELIHEVHSKLPGDKVNYRTSWLEIIESEELSSKYVGKEMIYQTAYILIMSSLNEVICESVAGGEGLRSFAFSDTYDEFDSVNLLLQLINDPESIDISTTIHSKKRKKETIKTLSTIPWSIIKPIITDQRFCDLSKKALNNPTKLGEFLDYISTNLDEKFVEEYDLVNNPVIRIGKPTASVLIEPIIAIPKFFIEIVLYTLGKPSLSNYLKEFFKKIEPSLKKLFTWRIRGKIKKIITCP